MKPETHFYIVELCLFLLIGVNVLAAYFGVKFIFVCAILTTLLWRQTYKSERAYWNNDK